MFPDSNSTRSNNTPPTSAHVKKEFNSTLKYAAMATRFKNIVVSGIVNLKSQVLGRSRSTFCRLDEVGLQIGVGFLDSMKLRIGFPIAFGDFDLR